MNRRERLHALVDALRAGSPRLVTVARLSERFGVSARTVQRDLQSLMAAGVPVRYESGPGGGWTIDRRHTLPPLQLTEGEATALVVAATASDAPVGIDVRTAVDKIRAVLSDETNGVVDAALASVAVLPRNERVAAVVGDAITRRTALELEYADASGTRTTRTVEPIGLLAGGGHWYLIAWCRERRSERGFRMDRISAARATAERVPARLLPEALADGPGAGARTLR
ncbi:WYL domain-containing protein [Tsukamurella sp. 8F]|uniref:helix-turn-helix transcriptional regulator n=1 Tax=unclassified Tsukamurella TaxID=2633480 RepID=UPI0023B9D85E|nr:MULTISPECIES: WYL domain-containing protein [unclassified Tsukamurella]MDF0530276.1 WYL domain-containing protein [Tsukamurella sp. 8J]MDF0588594.1 WYL domain-containing protein [Tsukamurella sp. 8F]